MDHAGHIKKIVVALAVVVAIIILTIFLKNKIGNDSPETARELYINFHKKN